MEKIKTKIRKLFYVIRRDYMTLNNVVLAIALIIAANWVWGALGMMQRNYSLQQEVDSMARELQVVQLQRDSLDLQQRYYQTEEYQELAVRESLGLVMPGEKMLILPKSDSSTDQTDDTTVTTPAQSDSVTTTSNFEQWLNFLFGGNNHVISQQDSNG